MTRSMTRMALVGCMALAGTGAVSVLDVGSSTAVAAPDVSPFAGTYAAGDWPAPIKISDAGRITSSYSGSDGRSKGTISGRVNADGSYSYTETSTWAYWDYLRHGRVPKEGWIWVTETREVAGNMTLDADGNVVGTTNTGGSFVWVRQ
jgi:hypothetical protein